MLEAKVKLGFTRTRGGSLALRKSPYELVSSDSVDEDKFLKFRVKGGDRPGEAAEKGVGDKFTVAEFNTVAADRYYKVSVKAVK